MNDQTDMLIYKYIPIELGVYLHIHSIYVNIYVDGVLKYSKTGISKTSGKVNFNVDVSNGSMLEITAGKEGYPSGDYHQEIGIVNAQLTK